MKGSTKLIIASSISVFSAGFYMDHKFTTSVLILLFLVHQIFVLGVWAADLSQFEDEECKESFLTKTGIFYWIVRAIKGLLNLADKHLTD